MAASGVSAANVTLPAQSMRSQQQDRDALFNQTLDVMVSTLGKRCRFALPVPEHLRAEASTTGPSAFTAPSTASTASNATTCKHEPAAQAIQAQAARDVCRSAVPTLSDWLRRVRSSKADGESALSDLSTLTERLESLNEIAAAVKEQSDHLSANASSLMVRKARLEHVQQELQATIRKFTKVEDLVREAEHPLLSATSARFPLLLEEMEETMQYLSENLTMKSSKPYAAKLALAQQRALLCLRDSVCVSFNDAYRSMTSSVAYAAAFRDKSNIPLTVAPLPSAAHVSNGKSVASADLPVILRADEGTSDAEVGRLVEVETLGALLASLNDTFVSVLDGAPASQRRLVEARCLSIEEDVHMTDILATYREVRTRILFPLLRDWLSAAETQVKRRGESKGQDDSLLAPMAAAVCSFLRDVLTEEKRLFETIWLRDDVNRVWDQTFAAELGEEMYHAFRSRLLQTDGLIALANGISSLRECLRDAAGCDASGEYSNLVKRMIQDTQERMVFRVSVFLRSSVGNRRVGPQEPQTLIQAMFSSFSFIPSETTPAQAAVFPLHPAVETCTTFLDVLYPAVERNVFGVFADECIHMTLTFLSKLTKSMSSTVLPGGVVSIHPPSTETEGGPADVSFNITLGNAKPLASLFYLQHLMALRESISLYDASLVSDEATLDLSQLVQRKIEILQQHREAKKDLEGDMRRTCEDIIQLLGHVVVETVQRSGGSIGSISACMRSVDFLMSKFIPNEATRGVLLRPIQGYVQEHTTEVTAPLVTDPAPPLEASAVAISTESAAGDAPPA